MLRNGSSVFSSSLMVNGWFAIGFFLQLNQFHVLICLCLCLPWTDVI